ncbi:peptide ABC transporter substrate-binding protein [Leucobacter sp.]
MNSKRPIRTSLRGRALRAGAAVAAATLGLGMVACAPAGNASSGGSGGDRALIALVQEPGVLNYLFASQSGAELTRALVQEPMFMISESGEYEPWLAAEIPTLDNGGISEDGKTVTFTIKEGVTWSDGEDFTAEDLAFTVAAVQDPASLIVTDPEYGAIEATRVIDPQTLEVTFSTPTPSFLNLFQVTLPEHEFDSPAIEESDPQVRLPLGTGPFVLEEWKSGDSITLDRNDDYWVDPELPKLDGVTVKITPDRESTMTAFAGGEYDSVFFFTGADFENLTQQEADGAPITTSISEEPWFVEWLWLNHSDGGELGTPHPVLGDPAIREAIDRGIDRQAIIDDVLGGFGSLTGSFLYSGVGSVPSEPAAFDPDAAAKALDDAGWALGSDGVREKDGVRASLKFQTIAGDHVRELYQQLIQQNLAEIGIEVKIENVPSNRLFDSRDQGGLLATGDFDLAMSRDGYAPDPTTWISQFTTASIPSDDNPSGISASWWSNADYDRLVQEASSEMDAEKRSAILGEIDTLFTEERVAIPLYAGINGMAWNSRLTGVDTGSWFGAWTSESIANWEVAGAGSDG